ncbi:hypothetical protein [uncultured Sphingopyxis sp.]|uniref:hypothetical protein n=1 Tax=uncultured Sphingopyxis sp. TaxID=310581 RepID=UPI0025D5FA6D|nr:hypothetical protein [uncultured Sphingopyxis sp.]
MTFSDLLECPRAAAPLEAVPTYGRRNIRWTKALAETLLLFSILSFLVGCGVRPASVINSRGTLPGPSEYRLSDEDIAAESVWRDRLVERLAIRGFRQGESPRYLVQIAQSSRSSRVVSGVQMARSSSNRQAGKERMVFAIAILDVEIGKPVYVASASYVGRMPLDEEAMEQLAEGLLPASDHPRIDGSR